MTLDVERLRAVAEAATPDEWHDGGVWWEHWTDPEGRLCHTPWPTVTHGSTGADITAKTTSEEDAAHIAAFDPPTVLALLDRLAAAEAKVARVRGLADERADLGAEQDDPGHGGHRDGDGLSGAENGGTA